MSVTQKEIVEALRAVGGFYKRKEYMFLADRIEREGIAPPDGWVSVSKLELDNAIEDLELAGLHDESGYKKLKAMLKERNNEQ